MSSWMSFFSFYIKGVVFSFFTMIFSFQKKETTFFPMVFYYGCLFQKCFCSSFRFVFL